MPVWISAGGSCSSIEDAMASDLEQLQGTWNITTLEIDGAPLPSAALNGASISIQGDRFTTASMGAEYSGRLKVDGEKTPHKTLAMYFETGPEAGNTNYGIYELTGDEWRLCLAFRGGAAPAEFVTAPGRNHALETLVRA